MLPWRRVGNIVLQMRLINACILVWLNILMMIFMIVVITSLLIVLICIFVGMTVGVMLVALFLFVRVSWQLVPAVITMVMVEIIFEERLNINIELLHFMQGMRFFSYFFFDIVVFSMPVLAFVFGITVGVMNVRLLPFIDVTWVRMVWSCLLLMVQTMLATIRCLKVVMTKFRLMERLTLRRMFVFIFRVSVGWTPGRMLAVHFALVDVLWLSLARITPI